MNSGYMSRYDGALMANCGKKLRSEMYTPPNQLAKATDATPGTCRIFCAYVKGIENTSDTALRVMRRADELAFAPAYQASTIVRSKPNAVIATIMPTTVRIVRSLWRSAFFSTRSATYMRFARLMDEHALLEMDQSVRRFGRLRIV